MGIDITLDMVEKARTNTVQAEFVYVDIREADIAKLPLPDAAHFYHQPLPDKRVTQNGPGLARHSDILLTMNTYSHVGQEEQAAAIGRLKGVQNYL